MFQVAPPPGPIEVEATISVRRYTETVAISAPATLDELAVSFSFVPEGTTLRLTRVDGGTTDVTRSPTGFTVTDAADLNHGFSDVQFRLPDQASKGVVVRSAREVRVGDTVDFGGANKLVVSGVTSPGGTIQVLDFSSAADISGVTTDRWVVWATEPTRVTPLRFAVTVSRGGAIVERYPSLGLDVTHPFYYFRDNQINGRSAMIRVTERDTSNAVDAGELPSTVEVSRQGTDGVALPADFRAGFDTLEAEPEPAMVICPETTEARRPAARRRRRSARWSPTARSSGASRSSTRRRSPTTRRSSPGATRRCPARTRRSTRPRQDRFARPRTRSSAFSLVPPSGFVAGVMARVDRTPPGRRQGARATSRCPASSACRRRTRSGARSC